MSRYIIRRLLQAIPLLFIISLILFVLMRASGDPVATMGGRRVMRPEDRERLARQLGLDKPIYTQYLYWLIGNDWTKIDTDGDGEGDACELQDGTVEHPFLIPGNPLLPAKTRQYHAVAQRPGQTCLSCHQGIAHGPAGTAPLRPANLPKPGL